MTRASTKSEIASVIQGRMHELARYRAVVTHEAERIWCERVPPERRDPAGAAIAKAAEIRYAKMQEEKASKTIQGEEATK